ncbi:MAG TPA: LytTR family DNA-binding domain-containing protein [Cellvibrio sp.]
MKALVVEDSRIAREGLVRMLKNYPELNVIGEADHPASALLLIEQTRPDVIFLDIHMPGETGFDLLEKLDYRPRIIFTTAYSEYAIKSFDYHTIDYLLKPISHERLDQAIAKLQLATGKQAAESREPLEMNHKIFIKDGDHCHLVTLESIRYFESCKNHVRIFFGDKSTFIKKSLNLIEERLPRKFFFRANRQYIVNLQTIRSIDEAIHDGFVLTLDNGYEIAVSRRQALDLKNLLSI